MPPWSGWIWMPAFLIDGPLKSFPIHMSATLLFRDDAAIDRSDVFNWTPISWEIFRSDFQSIYRDSQAGTGTFVLPAMNQRKKEPKNQILIGVYCGNQPAAFHYGSPDSAGAFRMRNTAVLNPSGARASMLPCWNWSSTKPGNWDIIRWNPNTEQTIMRSSFPN